MSEQSREELHEAFRSRRPGMLFRCQVGAGAGSQCRGTVRISRIGTHGRCSICNAEHDRKLRLTASPATV